MIYQNQGRGVSENVANKISPWNTMFLKQILNDDVTLFSRRDDGFGFE